MSVNLAVVRGVCSSPPEVRVLASGSTLVLLQLTIRTRRRQRGLGSRGHVGSPRRGAGARRGRRDRRVGSGAAPVLPQRRRHRIPGGDRGRPRRRSARSAARPSVAAAGHCGARPPRDLSRAPAGGAAALELVARTAPPMKVDAPRPGCRSRRGRDGTVGGTAQPNMKAEVNGDRSGEPDPSGGHARPGRDPVRGRLGRRYATGGRPLHRAQRRVRERPCDHARLPGGDPRPGRDRRRRLLVPGAHLRSRHRDAG